MSLRELYKGTKIIETIENYSFAEELSQNQENKGPNNNYYFFKDKDSSLNKEFIKGFKFD